MNHVSDSVSVVTPTGTPHVMRTLLIGDEPRDIVFGGAAGLAFITTAHRGQQRGNAADPDDTGAYRKESPSPHTSTRACVTELTKMCGVSSASMHESFTDGLEIEIWRIRADHGCWRA